MSWFMSYIEYSKCKKNKINPVARQTSLCEGRGNTYTLFLLQSNLTFKMFYICIISMSLYSKKIYTSGGPVTGMLLVQIPDPTR